MLKKRKLAAWGAVVCLLMLTMSSVTVFAAEETTEYVPKMYASFWALVPPVVAIVLALITKEVYSSLFVGIVIGGLFWSGFSFENTVLHVFQDGIVGVLTDSYNMGILVFLVILGIMVCMMNKAGGSAAVGYLHHWEGRCRGCAGRGHDGAAVLVPVLDRTGNHPFCWLEKQGIRGALSVRGTGSAGLYSGA